jgi:hypothetical protein
MKISLEAKKNIDLRINICGGVLSFSDEQTDVEIDLSDVGLLYLKKRLNECALSLNEYENKKQKG